ncbi:MAG: hypothetical protein LBR67_08535 [Dysgonamonadaceae bacterium]|jgi:hypothetical protein|nr:hypothetical protein [Dysgonamonadaceae bacterium]
MTVTDLQPAFNPVQLHLIEMFSYIKTEEAMNELQEVLLDFYKKKLNEETNRLWAEGVINDDKIEEMLNTHIRTPYK